MPESPDLRFTIQPEQREQKLGEIQQTSTFLWFIENTSYEQQKLLFAEIERIMEKGIPLIEFMQTGMTDAEVNTHEHRKIAILCFFESFQKIVDKNVERTKELHSNNDFNEAYDTALNEIISYLEGKRDDFPRDAVRCLFLLTDEYIDPHRQRLTATRLTFHSFAFCKTEEQKTEIEQLIKENMI